MNRPLGYLLLLAAFRLPALASGSAAPSAHPAALTAEKVNIQPTSLPDGSMAMELDPGLWKLEGYDLRGLLARAYELPASRVRFDAAGSAGLVRGGDGSEPRMDVSVVLQGGETDQAIEDALRSAIEQRFHVSAAVETRGVEVYVMSSPQGGGVGLEPEVPQRGSRKAAAQADRDGVSGGEITVEGSVCPGMSSIGIRGHGATLDGLAGALEDTLGVPVVNETSLAGSFDFRLAEYHSVDELLGQLRDQLGVTLTKERRAVRMLTVRRTGAVSEPVHKGL